MKAQMIRVISSPSSSTTGFTTLIFGIGLLAEQVRDGWVRGPPPAESRGNIASRHGRATTLFGCCAGCCPALDQVAERPEVGGIEVGDGPEDHAAARPMEDVIALPRFRR